MLTKALLETPLVQGYGVRAPGAWCTAAAKQLVIVAFGIAVAAAAISSVSCMPSPTGFWAARSTTDTNMLPQQQQQRHRQQQLLSQQEDIFRRRPEDFSRIKRPLHPKKAFASESGGTLQVERNGSALLDVQNVPLRTRERYVVDALNQHIKLACGNWHGLEQTTGVPGGLHLVDIDVLVARIGNLGFNCIRLPFSVQHVLTDPPIDNSAVLANPQFINTTWRTMFQATVHAIAQAGLMVILDRHMLWAGNNPSNFSFATGLWYADGISASDNVKALELLAEMTVNESLVVGIELINEPHDVLPGAWPDGGPEKPIFIDWGGGDPRSDLLMYYETAGNAVLAKNPNLLIILDGLCAATTLDHVYSRPVHLSLPHRIIYSVHSYPFYDTRDIMYGLTRQCVLIGLAITVFQLLLLQCWLRNGMPTASSEWTACFVFGGLGFWSSCLTIVSFLAYRSFRRGEVIFCDYLIQSTFIYVMWVFAALGMLLSIACVCNLWMLVYKKRKNLTFLTCEDPCVPGNEIYRRWFLWRFFCKRSLAFKLHEARQPVCHVGAAKYTNIPLTFAKQPWKWLAALVVHLVIWLTATFLVFLLVFGCWTGVQSTQWWFFTQMDGRWGYLLEGGRPYTAPVWIGEFGTANNSAFFQDSVNYFAEKDVDWGYWPLNPTRPCGGKVDIFTGFQPCEDPDSWIEDPFSVFANDWMSFRYPWQQERLLPIMK